MFLIHSCVSSTGFDSLLRKFPLRIKVSSCISRNIWKICVFQPLFITISCMRPFLSRTFYLFIDSSFARLIRVVGNIAPSVKFIPSNHYYSMTTIFSQIFNFIVGCVAWLFVKLCIVKLMIKIIILWMHVTKSNIMLWQCSWSWHSIVVKKIT